VDAVDLLRDGDMSVQIRVTGPGAAADERGRRQPVTSTCRTPLLPCRVNNARRSMKLSASCTAA
jgi:hypothetical protein